MTAKPDGKYAPGAPSGEAAACPSASEPSAILSPCRTYRYTLTRQWSGGAGTINFIGLNPSTADETQDDPTIRRCTGFAKSWGFARFVMLNLFAFRATDPKEMMRAADPVGPDNNAHIARHVAINDTVAAWGNGGWYRGRGPFIHDIYPQLMMLRLTGSGHPAHPLYLPKTLRPQAWSFGASIRGTAVPPGGQDASNPKDSPNAAAAQEGT